MKVTNYLYSNLNYIKQKDLKLYNSLYKIWREDITNQKIQIIKSKSNEDIIEIISGNEKIRLNSIYNAKREAEVWAKKYENIEEATSVIMYGYGSGIFFREIKKKLNDSTYVFLYEPDIELFLFCLKSFDMTEFLAYNNLFIYISGINEMCFFRDLCDNINWSMLSEQIVCVHTGYRKINKNEYINFEKKLNEFIYAAKISQNTLIKFAKKFTINLLKNLHFIKESNYLGEFENILSNEVPVIIISAGPSLDKNIEELRKAEKKAVILATDTAVKTLVRKKIKFDAIVTIDGDKKIDSISEGVSKNKSLFTVPDAKNEFLEENKGRKIWINGAGYVEKLYRKFGCFFPKYSSGGSVATAAFEIAKVLGAKRIILVGQDLAYNGNNTHAGLVRDDYVESGKEIYVEGVFGIKVKTRQDWLRYLQWFENSIAQLQDEIEVIDATEGGAKIHGTRIMELSDAIKEYCNSEYDFEEVVNNKAVTFIGEKYHIVEKTIKNIKSDFREINKNATQAIDTIKEIKLLLENKTLNKEKFDKYMQIILQKQEDIQKYDVYILLDEYISADVAEMCEDENKICYDYIDKYRILFSALIKATNELETIDI